MTERKLPDGIIEKDGIYASTRGIEGIPSADDSGNTIDIIRLHGNHDWSLKLVKPDGTYMFPLRFPTSAGGDISLFVGDELFNMLNAFMNNPTRVKVDQETDEVYGPEAGYIKGTEADDFELEVVGIQGMGVIGEMFDEYERFLDVKVYKDGIVKVTVRNREDNRDDHDGSWPTAEQIAQMPVTSASVLLLPEGKTALFAQSFKNIAVRAANAIQRDIELYQDSVEDEDHLSQ